MNIRCPHCQTVFRVNPERIPPAGVRARCARCGDSFMVTPPKAEAGGPQAASQGAPPSAPPASAPHAQSPASAPFAQPKPAAFAPRPAEHRPYTTPAPPAAPAQAERDTKPRPAPASAPFAGAPAPTPPPQAAPAPAATALRSPFGQRDPSARAARIARALVSDIVAYHPERREESLQAGTLRTEFREEIMKSWEEYVAQVGQPLAKSTPFFRDALNAILANGQQVF
jgi:predicted Zn finger-like uncharacterized protein